MIKTCKPAGLAARTAMAGLAALAFAGAATGAIAAEAKAASIEGVWKVTDVVITGANPLKNPHPQESVYIFAHGHYANVQVTGEKSRTASPTFKDPAKPTDAEKLARYDEWAPFGAQAGTYAVKGAKLTRTPTVAKAVGAVTAGAYDSDMKLTGDTLVLTSHAAAGQPAREQTLTFTRGEVTEGRPTAASPRLASLGGAAYPSPRARRACRLRSHRPSPCRPRATPPRPLGQLVGPQLQRRGLELGQPQPQRSVALADVDHPVVQDPPRANGRRSPPRRRTPAIASLQA